MVTLFCCIKLSVTLVPTLSVLGETAPMCLWTHLPQHLCQLPRHGLPPASWHDSVFAYENRCAVHTISIACTSRSIQSCPFTKTSLILISSHRSLRWTPLGVHSGPFPFSALGTGHIFSRRNKPPKPGSVLLLWFFSRHRTQCLVHGRSSVRC